jgi:protein O-GlcNAc transferase
MAQQARSVLFYFAVMFVSLTVAQSQGEMPAAMTKDEQSMILKYMGQARTYFEWGCGGSTMLACSQPSIQQVYSVDAHKTWVGKVNAAAASGACSDKQLSMQYIDVGEVGLWSHPIENNLTKWAAYSQAIRGVDGHLDLVLIDGRWRVSCLFETLAAVDDATIIVIHDFWWRPFYHRILPFVTVIDRVDSMVVCKKAPIDASKELLHHMSEYHVNQPS